MAVCKRCKCLCLTEQPHDQSQCITSLRNRVETVGLDRDLHKSRAEKAEAANDTIMRERERVGNLCGQKSAEIDSLRTRLETVEAALEEMAGTDCFGFHEGNEQLMQYTPDGRLIDDPRKVVVVNAEDFQSWLDKARAALRKLMPAKEGNRHEG